MGPYVLRVRDARGTLSTSTDHEPCSSGVRPTSRPARWPTARSSRARRTLHIGRCSTMTSSLSTSVSRRHAAMYQEDGRWMVADLGSANGTLINQRPLTQPAVLGRGAHRVRRHLRYTTSDHRHRLFSPIRSERGWQFRCPRYRIDARGRRRRGALRDVASAPRASLRCSERAEVAGALCYPLRQTDVAIGGRAQRRRQAGAAATGQALTSARLP